MRAGSQIHMGSSPPIWSGTPDGALLAGGGQSWPDAETQLPAAKRLVGEGLETIAWRLKGHAGSDSLILAGSAELRLSAMLCRGETVIALMATGGDWGVAVPAAQGAELYLSLRAVERLLVDALTQAA